MKDLEKIKSEEVAVQVQDANPGNFAIEQEVAQLVGATVPAPTEPSADDARELGAQLLVFLRRALLPIRSALRTAVAAIYAHLDSRCTDYTPAAYDPFRAPLGPYDPMRPLTPRTLPNLLTALTAFSDRKISIGDGSTIPDGMPFVRLACSTDKDIAKVLIDDSEPWAMVSILPCYGLTALRLNCSSSVVPIAITMPDLKSLSLPELVDVVTPSSFVYQCGVEDTVELPKLKYYRSTTGSSNYFFSNLPNVEVISLPELLAPYGDAIMFMANNPELREIYLPKVTKIYLVNNAALSNNPKLEKIVFGDYPTITYRYGNNGSHDVVPKSTAGVYKDCPNLIRIEVRGEVNSSIYLNHWSPTNALDTSRNDLVEDPTAHPTWNNLDQFLQNFREHIALRLTANGSGKTLTLSQAVRNAIHAAESTYGIENIIVTQKGWTISPAPN